VVQEFRPFLQGCRGLSHLLQCHPAHHADNSQKGMSHLQAQVPQRVPLPVVPLILQDNLPPLQPTVLRSMAAWEFHHFHVSGVMSTRKGGMLRQRWPHLQRLVQVML
ncbi:unnamed protein product, partial [Symbiodinium pilosum]